MLLEEKNIHLTDLSFFKFLEYNYEVNRGVYNTIDSWFYEKGEKDILQRRKKILEFLNYVNVNGSNKSKFGKGGLSNKLKEFSEQIYDAY